MKQNTFSALFIFLFSIIGFSQTQEIAPPDFIKTITFKGTSIETQLPIIKLGDALSLEFDALNGDEDDYYYKIEHFNYDWTPSVLVKSEYMDGFDNQRIRNYENSFNTYQIYSHYSLSIPNAQTKGLKVSGNYMISVYNDNGEPVFFRKFMVYENVSTVGIALKRSRDLEFIDEKQRTEISITPQNFTFNNPKQTVKLLIIQNNNLNTAITDIKPQYTVGNQLIYKYDTETAFWGGNEYLFFENKDIRGATNAVQFVDLKDLYHNYLFTNLERASKPYTYNPDINGSYVVTALDAENPNIEADYAWVHFSLKAEDYFSNNNVYVYGSFNNFELNDTNKMNYDEGKNVFVKSILLKQGFYNYKYVILNKEGFLDEGAIGGNFYQTENNYKVVVYYRDLGGRYDKIVGLGEGTSVNISN
ncbi:MAG: type IX secretion system plug protein domain-containing protein [Flavobacteriaceae bacterium]